METVKNSAIRPVSVEDLTVSTSMSALEKRPTLPAASQTGRLLPAMPLVSANENLICNRNLSRKHVHPNRDLITLLRSKFSTLTQIKQLPIMAGIIATDFSFRFAAFEMTPATVEKGRGKSGGEAAAFTPRTTQERVIPNAVRNLINPPPMHSALLAMPTCSVSIEVRQSLRSKILTLKVIENFDNPTYEPVKIFDHLLSPRLNAFNKEKQANLKTKISISSGRETNSAAFVQSYSDIHDLRWKFSTAKSTAFGEIILKSKISTSSWGGKNKLPKAYPVRDKISVKTESRHAAAYPARDTRSVETEYRRVATHPVRDASLTGCRMINVSPFSTERFIPNGMPNLKSKIVNLKS